MLKFDREFLENGIRDAEEQIAEYVHECDSLCLPYGKCDGIIILKNRIIEYKLALKDLSYGLFKREIRQSFC